MVNHIKRSVLIVDDNTKNIQVLSSILHENGYNISISISGINALESIKTKLPDLILLDIEMPEMDGYEVCRRLKLNPITQNIPVIFLTAKIETENIVKGFELGAVDYIIKPFVVAELLARVTTHIEIRESRQALLELNATKDKFFSIIAHDLKNPFAGILLSCELLLKQLYVYEKPQIEKKINRISTSAQNGFDLLSNLLEWSRSQTGNIQFAPAQIYTEEIIQESIDSVRQMSENKNIEIKYSETNQVINADPNLLKTVIRNLLTNAIKFTPQNGKIIISSTQLIDSYEFSISDNGVGIPSEVCKNLFKIENKTSTKGTANEVGTGIGLILCKEFIEIHGGKIWVESKVDVGSKFSFTVPVGNV